MHFRFVRIQNFENLLGVSFRVSFHFLFRERFSRLRFSCRIPDPPGEIADNEMDFVAAFLKLAQFVQHDGMSDMNIGRTWIETELDRSGFPCTTDWITFCSSSSSGTISTVPLRITSSCLLTSCLCCSVNSILSICAKDLLLTQTPSNGCLQIKTSQSQRDGKFTRGTTLFKHSAQHFPVS